MFTFFRVKRGFHATQFWNPARMNCSVPLRRLSPLEGKMTLGHSKWDPEVAIQTKLHFFVLLKLASLFWNSKITCGIWVDEWSRIFCQYWDFAKLHFVTAEGRWPGATACWSQKGRIENRDGDIFNLKVRQCWNFQMANFALQSSVLHTTLYDVSVIHGCNTMEGIDFRAVRAAKKSKQWGSPSNLKLYDVLFNTDVLFWISSKHSTF